MLVGVDPGAEESGDVLGDPDEEADQHEGQRHGHPVAALERGEVHAAVAELPEQDGDQQPAPVADEMVGEEVGVDRQCQRQRDTMLRVSGQAQLELPPGLGHVTGNRRVHETGIQRHTKHFRVAGFRIAPRPYARMRLEHFQREAEHMEQADDADFLPGFQAQPQQQRLQAECRQQQEVIARKIAQRQPFRQRENGEEATGEQAAADFLQTEPEEVAHYVFPDQLATERSAHPDPYRGLHVHGLPPAEIGRESVQQQIARPRRQRRARIREICRQLQAPSSCSQT